MHITRLCNAVPVYDLYEFFRGIIPENFCISRVYVNYGSIRQGMKYPDWRIFKYAAEMFLTGFQRLLSFSLIGYIVNDGIKERFLVNHDRTGVDFYTALLPTGKVMG